MFYHHNHTDGFWVPSRSQGRAICPRAKNLNQDWLRGWWSLTDNETVRFLVPKLWRISRWWEQSNQPSVGPSQCRALCDLTGHTPMTWASPQLWPGRLWGLELSPAWLTPEAHTLGPACIATANYCSFPLERESSFLRNHTKSISNIPELCPSLAPTWKPLNKHDYLYLKKLLSLSQRGFKIAFL